MKDIRYNIIKPLLLQGQIASFTDIFKYIPKSVVAIDLGLNVSRFTRSIENVGTFRVGDLLQLAELCGIDPMEMFGLVDKQLQLGKTKKKK
jgi:hypothetical protein